MDLLSEVTQSKACVIIQIGRRHLKAGFSRRLEPFVILQTSELFSKCEETVEIKKNENENEREYVTLFKESKYWRRDLSILIRKLYMEHLRCNSKDYPVLLLERALFPSELSSCICNILYETFEVPAIKRISEPITSLFTTGILSGIIVDIGTNETIITPIYNGYPIEYNIKVIQCGYLSLRDNFKKMLLEQCKLNEPDKVKQIENISDKMLDNLIFRSAIVREYFESEKCSIEINDLAFENIFLNDEYINIFVSKETRHKPFNIFFGEKQNESNVVHNIVLDGIIDCIKFSNMEIRKEISQNIIICGGVGSVPGFEQRIQNELKEYASNDKNLSKISDHIFVSSPPISPFLRSYTGAVIMLLTDKRPNFTFIENSKSTIFNIGSKNSL
ncbi:actin [Cryptosporidium ryanae]|uniref:actin n=1 Tax=Cryptosporidium ryanae TaxID=515981 RepID=UPI00351A4537|nr:actin [Cryptosporidium ryanae]